LFSDPEGRFRNYWETGTMLSFTDAEAAETSKLRAGTERNLGYAATVGADTEASAPAGQRARDLPKYAALLSPLRPEGLVFYGDLVFVWNADVRARSTFTPYDSGSSPDESRHVTGADHLYPLLAYGDDHVVRVAYAEATGFAYDEELQAMHAAGERPWAYFEAQIHGDLLWSDLDQITISYPAGWQVGAAACRDRIREYAHQRGLDLRVELALQPSPPG
jgi:hypothetical protein